MAGERPQRSFWTTLPGILTGVATIIAALGGLFGGLAALGVFQGSSQPIIVITPTATAPSNDTPTMPALVPTATLTPQPVDTSTAVPVDTPIPADTPAPIPTSTPTPEPSILDISGIWFYPNGFVEISRAPSSEGEYSYQDFNSFQVLVGEGVASQTTTRVVLDGVNSLFGPTSAEFEITSSLVMQGIVCYTSGCTALVLSR